MNGRFVVSLRVVFVLGAGFLGIGTAAAQSEANSQPNFNTVLLETITITGAQTDAIANPPRFEEQLQRFLRGPGAVTAVSLVNQDPGKKNNLTEALISVPGVFLGERGAGTSSFISMRGSDIATDGSRNGRGIRAYLDGIPLGRTDAGLTNALIDLYATDYVEVYRGANSLRYGAIATGGALNFVSKTGLTFQGTGISIHAGSFGNVMTQLEHGGFNKKFDWYFQGNGFNNDGFQAGTQETNLRFSGNFGWRPTENIETRTYFAVGRTRADLALPMPLNQLATLRRTEPRIGNYPYHFDQDLNLDYQRFANRTIFRADNTTYELGFYLLNTKLDHLPVPMAGIIDYKWFDVGAFGRVEHKTELWSLPTELVAGVRVGHTTGDFNRYRSSDFGTVRGQKLYDWDFSSWLIESYGEASVEVLPRVKLFTGLQGVHTTRVLEDRYTGGAVGTIPPVYPVFPHPQPGRIAGLQEYDRDFKALNPKFGVNWEYNTGHFLFANVAKSYEVPSGADLAEVLSVEASTGTDLPDLKAQSAWTWEAGVRGGWRRFQYDVTLYHMRLRNEILTRCGATCATTVAFNADRTIHNGIELGLKTIPFVDVFVPDDNIFVNGVWNITQFSFDNDPIYGNNRLPVIPRHQIFAEVGYRHPSGFFGLVNIRHLSDRKATYNGTGGDAFIVPSYTLLGAKFGYKDPAGVWTAYVEGRNLTDKVFVSEFVATPTATGVSPSVRPGDGRAFYAGVSRRF